MPPIERRSWSLMAAAALAAAALPEAASAQAATRNRVVFQMSDGDPERWNIVLHNMQNLREGVGSEGADIELVAYGPGVSMFKADSPFKDRVADATKAGVKFAICQNTMKNMKLNPADMLPDLGYVPAGVIEVMRKQQQGWAYIRV